MSELEDTFEPLPEEPQAEQVAETPPETTEAKAEPPEVAETADPEPVEAEDNPKAHSVPLPVYLAQRDEMKEMRAKVEALEKAPQPQPQTAPIPRPDQFEDPDGARAWDERQLHMRDLNRSERMAKREHGDDFVQEAFAAAQAAGMAEQFGRSQFGWEDMADWHKRNVEAQEAKSLASEIGDPAAYKAKIRDEILAELKAEMATEQVKNLPSLANETSIGGRAAPAADTFTSLDDIL